MMNQYISKMEGSASMRSMQMAAELKRKGVPVIDLAGGEPDFDTPLRIREKAKEALDAGHTHYAVGKGIYPLRKAISERLQKENKIQADPGQIIVTPGGKFGIYLALTAILNPGDEVLVFAPYWVSYVPIIKACGGVPVVVPLTDKNDYKIERDTVEKKITDRTKMLIINYPNNPTGRILHQEEAEILRDLIMEYDLYAVADEIYDKIVFDGKKNISLASFPEIRDSVVTVNGFSKCAAMTGWRIGYTAAGPEITKVMYRLFEHSITGVSTFIQEAALEVFECDAELEEMRKIYEKRRDYMVEEINKIPNLSCKCPEGAFYLWIKIDTDLTSEQACEKFLEQGNLVCVPSDSYGETKAAYVRCSFANDMKILQNAVEKFSNVVLK